MDIFIRISDDHKKQRELMAAIEATQGDTSERRKLFSEFALEFRAHAAAEEHAFYAELMTDPETTDQSRHSVAEHHEAMEILEELEKGEFGSSGWLTRFKTLSHDNEHHMKEEEDDVMPLAKKHCDSAKLDNMLQLFDSRKETELT